MFINWVNERLKTKHKESLPEHYAAYRREETANNGFILPEVAHLVPAQHQNYCDGIIQSHHLGDLMSGLSGLVNVAIHKLTSLVTEQIQKKRKTMDKVRLLHRLSLSFHLRNSLGFNDTLNPKDLRLLRMTQSENIGSISEARKPAQAKPAAKVSNFESIRSDLTSLDSVPNM